MCDCNSPLRTFYQFLAARKRCEAILCERFNCQNGKKLPLVLTRQQVRRLLAAPTREEEERAAPSWMPLRDVAIMELFYSSGLRLSELASLNVADVDLYTESVRVFGKGRKERVCPVGLPALESISRYRAAANVHADPLFINKARKRLSARSIWLVLKRYVRTRQFQFRSVRTSCGIVSPRTCWTAAPICAVSRHCSATPVCRPPKSTLT